MSPRGSACELAAAIRRRECSAREVCVAALERTERDELGCFWSLDADRALRRAAEVDAALAGGGDPGPLAGVPVAVKDCFDVAGLPTTCGVRWDPPASVAAQDAEAVRLLTAAGAIVIGKTAMHQLAWGMSGEAPGFPVNRNPHDPARMPGGSSGGSAAAVAAGIVPLALGTDCGGSVRQPASWCGGVGFKPTLGAIDLAGCAPLSRALDTAGPIAASVEDCAVAFSVLSGSALRRADARTVRVGVLEAQFEEVEAGVEETCRAALDRLAAAGAFLEPVELAWERRVLSPIYAVELADEWGERIEHQGDAIAEDVREGVERGRRTLAVDYLAARRRLNELQAAAPERAAAFDALAGPTSPMLPPLLRDPDPTTLAGRNTRVFNALGWPAISLPCGQVGALPVGLQLAAAAGRDADLLALAERFEEPLLDF